MMIKKTLILLLLLAVFFSASLPGYLTGKWRWNDPLPIPNLTQIATQGLTLEGWQNRVKSGVRMGAHKWLIQEIWQDDKYPPLTILLSPQNSVKDKPELEWLEIKHYYQMDIKSEKIKEFVATNGKIKANLFYAQNKTNNFVVLQWYAWHNGGSPLANDWFWRDQKAQLFNQRLPWVAVSIIIPIGAVNDLEMLWPKIEIIAEKVQSSLMKSI